MKGWGQKRGVQKVGHHFLGVQDFGGPRFWGPRFWGSVQKWGVDFSRSGCSFFEHPFFHPGPVIYGVKGPFFDRFGSQKVSKKGLKWGSFLTHFWTTFLRVFFDLRPKTRHFSILACQKVGSLFGTRV